MNSTAIHNYWIVEIDSHSQVQQPNMTTKEDFYKIYSPKKFKLRLRDDIYLDLKIKISVPNTLEPWMMWVFCNDFCSIISTPVDLSPGISRQERTTFTSSTISKGK